jgi:1,4-dihydroxy-2-naphthoyl-CoA synthase
VQPRDRLDTRVDELVDAICHRSALTQHAAKEMVESIVAGGALDPALTARWTQLAETSGERDEGLSAFIERREPAFGWRP